MIADRNRREPQEIASQIRERLSAAFAKMDAVSTLFEGEVALRDDRRRKEVEV